jgi:hypothetical protein
LFLSFYSIFNKLISLSVPCCFINSKTSKIIFKLFFNASKSLGFALHKASLVRILSKSATFFNLFVTISNKTDCFKNSSIILCLFFISSISCKGFTIDSLKNLLHIAVFVLSITQKRVHNFDDFDAKLYNKSRLLIVDSSKSINSEKVS